MSLLFLLVCVVFTAHAAFKAIQEIHSLTTVDASIKDKNPKLYSLFRDQQVMESTYPVLRLVQTADPEALRKAITDIKTLFKDSHKLFQDKSGKEIVPNDPFLEEYRKLQQFDPNASFDLDGFVYSVANCLLTLKTTQLDVSFVGNFDFILNKAIRILAEAMRNYDKWPAEHRDVAKAIFDACGVNFGLKPWQIWSIVCSVVVFVISCVVIYIIVRRRAVLKQSKEEEEDFQ